MLSGSSAASQKRRGLQREKATGRRRSRAIFLKRAACPFCNVATLHCRVCDSDKKAAVPPDNEIFMY
jgi:hypothetical protein